MYGWSGKIAVVDLTTSEIEEKEIEEEILRKYIGGRGLAAYLLYTHLKKNIDPFDPQNLLIFSVGPLTGTPSPTSKANVTSKSPLTGTIFDCQSGGVWGVKFKRCGYDALIIKGKAKKPVYIKIVNKSVEIKDATQIWKLDTHQTTDKINEIEGKNFSVACIGPAGENLVRMACIINDKSRAFGRGGLGAVMGSKNLKAVVVDGDLSSEIFDREKFNFFVHEANKNLKSHPITSKALPKYGTAVLVNLMNAFGIFPTRNFQDSEFEDAEKISGETISQKILVKKHSGCYGCGIIQCARRTKTRNMEGEGPEYESVWSLGANCGISDLEVIAEANYLCNLYGMDTISIGGTIACAMELNKRSIGSFGINFGDSGKLKDVITKIAFREGIGDELAEGSKKLSEKYGSPETAMQVKGLGLPAYDPRGAQGMGLAYSTSNRGACHLRGGYAIGPEILGVPRRIDRFATTGKAGHVVRLQDFGAAVDSLIVCRFTTFALTEHSWARILSSVVGVEYQPEELLKVGERIFNLERLFNLREGFSWKDDTLPKRLLEEPVKGGASKGHVVKLSEMLKEYYEFRGWDEFGVPKQEKLKDLEIE